MVKEHLKNICCIMGTRPEAIKMAPIIKLLQKEPWANTFVLATAQHRDMLDDVLKVFAITPDQDLNIMQPNQSLPNLTSRLIDHLSKILEHHHFDLIVAQGDTTTIFAAALVAFYKNIPFAHIEAGLRTYDMRHPFPEEMNRVLASRLTTWHFAPTELAKENLLTDNIEPNTIFVVGNTVIDALLMTIKKKFPLPFPLAPEKKLILVTAHRRESFGQPLLQICAALRTLATRFNDIEIVYPVHPNPNIKDIVHKELANQPNIKLLPPLRYDQLIPLMNKAYLFLTDSGGIQEEASALAKPILVLRNETERSEILTAGMGKLVGTDTDDIITAVTELLTDPKKYDSMTHGLSPYGDGHAAEKIVKILQEKLRLIKGSDGKQHTQ